MKTSFGIGIRIGYSAKLAGRLSASGSTKFPNGQQNALRSWCGVPSAVLGNQATNETGSRLTGDSGRSVSHGTAVTAPSTSGGNSFSCG